MPNVECCGLPRSGLADYSLFQNELPHFDDETYSQRHNLTTIFYHANTIMNYPLHRDSNTLLWYYISISDLCKKIFDDFYNLLCLLPQPPVIIALSEARISLHRLSNIEISGYTFYYSNSPSKAGCV